MNPSTNQWIHQLNNQFIDLLINQSINLLIRTCEKERGHLVLQIGTSNGDRAAQVARKMEQGKDYSSEGY